MRISIPVVTLKERNWHKLDSKSVYYIDDMGLLRGGNIINNDGEFIIFNEVILTKTLLNNHK